MEAVAFSSRHARPHDYEGDKLAKLVGIALVSPPNVWCQEANIRRELRLLQTAPSSSKAHLVVEGFYSERKRGNIEKGSAFFAQAAIAWVRDDFWRYLKEKSASGEFGSLHGYEETNGRSALLSHAELAAGQQDGLSAYLAPVSWDFRMLDDAQESYVRYLLIHEIEQAIIGFNIGRLFMQVGDPNSERWASAYGLRADDAPNTASSVTLVSVSREAAANHSETAPIRRLFAYTKPIFDLKEKEKRLVLLGMKHMNLTEIAQHDAAKRVSAGTAKLSVKSARGRNSTAMIAIREKIRHVNEDCLPPAGPHWEVIEFLSKNMSELRPSARRRKRAHH